jgi:uncharacterized protein (TIGR02246 family)
MKYGVKPLSAACLLSLLLLGCDPTEQSVPDSGETDVDAIRQADLAWVEAQAADGLEGTMSFYLDDGIMLPPNMPMAIGKPAIREASAALGIGAPGSSVTWQPIKIEVARSGELAYAIGTFEGYFIDDAGNQAPTEGKYVEIWKKQPDGTWMVAADMFSPDSAPVAAP